MNHLPSVHDTVLFFAPGSLAVNAAGGERDKICDSVRFILIRVSVSVLILDRGRGRLRIILFYLFIHFRHKVFYLLHVTVFKQRHKTAAAIASYKAEIFGSRLKDIGELADHLVSSDMPPQVVYRSDIGEIEHDAADVIRQRFVQIFLNHGIAAVAVGDAGHRVGGNSEIQLSVIFLKRRKKTEIHKNEKEGEDKDHPEQNAQQADVGIVGYHSVELFVREDDGKSQNREKHIENQLNGFKQIKFFHGISVSLSVKKCRIVELWNIHNSV